MMVMSKLAVISAARIAIQVAYSYEAEKDGHCEDREPSLNQKGCSIPESKSITSRQYGISMNCLLHRGRLTESQERDM